MNADIIDAIVELFSLLFRNLIQYIIDYFS